MSKLNPKIGEIWRTFNNRKLLIVAKHFEDYYGLTLGNNLICNSFYAKGNLIERVQDASNLFGSLKEALANIEQDKSEF